MKYILILCFCLTGCATVDSDHGIPNLRLVRPGVYRGGQPTDAGWVYLYDVLRLTNDIKLNTKFEASDKKAKALGMRVIYLPINTWQQMFGPVGPQLESALTNVVPGTFFHCQHGVNRTGTLGILDRVKHDEYTWREAIDEAKVYGWNSSLPALKSYINKHATK